MLTIDKLKDILPNNKDVAEWHPILIKYLNQWNITSVNAIAMFFAQTSHESNQYTVLLENLNYSKEGLLKTFPKYFNDSSAMSYARKPIMIANRVYANRMGNGNELSGDGWKFRGKGIIQITGKSNHEEFSKVIEKSLDDTLQYLLTKEGCVHYACYYWKTRNLLPPSERADVKTVTRLINGGWIGLEHRQSEFNRIKNVLTK